MRIHIEIGQKLHNVLIISLLALGVFVGRGDKIDPFSKVHLQWFGVTQISSPWAAATVQTAIDGASDGDIIELTGSGTATWTATVTIPNTKGITLRVAGGTNTPKGSSNFPITVTSNQDPIIDVDCENSNSLLRITGFKFQNSINSDYGAIRVEGRGTGTGGLGAYRIDNNYFDTIQNGHTSLSGTLTLNSSTGVMTGLIDNNTLHDCSYTDGYTIAITEMWRDGGGDWSYGGGNAWSRALGFGTDDFVFIEDNLIENIDQYTRHMVMGIAGSKYVIRYNQFDIQKQSAGSDYSQIIDAHGLCICATIGQGARGGEIYSNTFDGGAIQLHNCLFLRGGSWLAYNNVFESSSASANGHIALSEYRAGSVCSQCTGTCTAIDPWYQCVTDSPSRYPLEQQIGYGGDSYFWNNKYGEVTINPVVNDNGNMRFYVQVNRDFFNSEYSYTPYTYPHPLRGEGLKFSVGTRLRF